MADADLAGRLRFYVVTDPGATGGMITAARGALEAGATAVQLRWKGGAARQQMEAGRQLRELTRASEALFIVNDRMDVALALGADGVHLGDDDLPVAAARSIAPAEFVIGRSVDTVEEALAAAAGGADYLGAGPVYATRSKTDTGPVMGVQGLAAIAGAVQIPVVGIGGIEAGRVAEVLGVAAGAAMLGAVMMAPDPTRAMAEIRTSVLQG